MPATSLTERLLGLQPSSNIEYALKPSFWDELVKATGNTASGMAQSIGSALMAPGNALAGNYNQLQIGPDGSVTPMDPRMIGDATNLAGLVSLAPVGAPEVPGAVNMGIRAYHGSPHSFDKFDVSKIGTGEGAQAYGHGLYFAENEGVAKGYRDALKTYETTVDGKPIDKNSPTFSAAMSIAAHGYDQTLADLEGAKRMSFADPEWIQAQIDATKSLKNAKIEAKPRGSMYAVDINAEPHHFLDWDKPFSEQSDAVKSSLTPQALGLHAVGPLPGRGMYGWANDAGHIVGSLNSKAPPEKLFHDNELGMSIYRALSEDPSTVTLSNPAVGSNVMSKTGIKGIKYRDAGSRGSDAETATHNYVVFDDKNVNILKKYGVGGGAVLGGLAGLGGMKAGTDRLNA